MILDLLLSVQKMFLWAWGFISEAFWAGEHFCWLLHSTLIEGAWKIGSYGFRDVIHSRCMRRGGSRTGMC